MAQEQKGERFNGLSVEQPMSSSPIFMMALFAARSDTIVVTKVPDVTIEPVKKS